MLKKRKHILFLIAVFIILFLVEYFSPKPIDWTISLKKEDKIPYGTYILYDLLPDVFQGNNVYTSESTIYETLIEDTLQNENLIFISNNFTPDSLDLDQLYQHVQMGGNVFIAASFFSQNFSDSLNFEIDYPLLGTHDSLIVNFVNPKLKHQKGYIYKKAVYQYQFNKFDTLSSTVLSIFNHKFVNFIEVKYGAGNFYLCSQPLLFTNYNLLINDNANYAFTALSYLPNRDVIWDAYIKPDKSEINSSVPVRYILSQPPLKAAWLTLLVGMLLYIIFESKRRERPIPVISGLKNASLEFAHTVGRLYYRTGNHKDLAHKKFIYFTDILRSKYNLNTDEFTPENYKKIALKTGTSTHLIRDIFNHYKTIEKREISIPANELFSFTNKIEQFYIESNNKIYKQKQQDETLTL